MPLPRAAARAAVPAAAAAALIALAGCAGTADAAGGIAVTSDDTACALSSSTGTAGPVTFTVTNTGGQVTEFYVLAQDGLRVLGEVENVAPDLSRDLVVELDGGSYVAACKPGMTGEGIRSTFTISGAAPSRSGSTAAALEAATTSHEAYVRDQVGVLVARTKEFAAAYAAGDAATAKALYAPARVPWERIEPVAESFGDLDPKLDAREGDTEPGTPWTGWHRIEKDLWAPAGTPLGAAARRELADALVADTLDLQTRVATTELRPDQLGNGAKELLDEVATGKVTGEEERYSHTDLWDFQANIDGARVAYEALRPALQANDAELDTTLASRFTSLQALLDRYRDGDGFVLYTALTPSQVKELATAVDALGDPLAGLTAAVVR